MIGKTFRKLLLLLALAAAVGALSSCKPNVERLEQKQDVRGLIRALDHQEADVLQQTRVRRTAAQALGRIGDPQAVEPLITALMHDLSPVAIAAAHALVRFHITDLDF